MSEYRSEHEQSTNRFNQIQVGFMNNIRYRSTVKHSGNDNVIAHIGSKETHPDPALNMYQRGDIDMHRRQKGFLFRRL